jgi:hypothetical protein
VPTKQGKDKDVKCGSFEYGLSFCSDSRSKKAGAAPRRGVAEEELCFEVGEPFDRECLRSLHKSD